MRHRWTWFVIGAFAACNNPTDTDDTTETDETDSTPAGVDGVDFEPDDLRIQVQTVGDTTSLAVTITADLGSCEEHQAYLAAYAALDPTSETYEADVAALYGEYWAVGAWQISLVIPAADSPISDTAVAGSGGAIHVTASPTADNVASPWLWSDVWRFQRSSGTLEGPDEGPFQLDLTLSGWQRMVLAEGESAPSPEGVEGELRVQGEATRCDAP